MTEPSLEDLAALWLATMREGDWSRAWQISDEVLRRSDRRGMELRPRHLQSVWDGTALAGKHVLVRCYHGLGDTVQFVRFARPLREIAARVSLWAQPQLVDVLTRVDGVDEVLPLHDGEINLRYDVDIEIMELPYALGTSLQDLPNAVPYIGDGIQRFTSRASGHLAVGLVWASGDWDETRSIHPQLFVPLMQIPHITWKVLQRGPALARCPPGLGTIPRLACINDELRELASLDLLVTVDTASAHLAGALGVRTWTLLPTRADWRWMQERDDSPWYPTMRLFRQDGSDWAGVLSRVEKALRELASVIE